MQQQREEGIVFKATWRSSVGWLVLVLCAMALGAGWMSLSARSGALLWSASALFMAWMVWLVGRQFWSSRPLLAIGRRGITGYWLKGHLVPWSEIADIRRESVQGNSYLVIKLLPGASSLKPTMRMFGGRSTERRVVLTGLKEAEASQAAEAAMRAFALYGGAQGAAAIQARMEEHAAEIEFEARLKSLTPVPWALYLVVALNTGVWGANLVAGMSPMAPLAEDLFRWGANSAWAVTREGEYWRLLSAAFLHGGIVHLALNMLGLWSAGLLVNRMYGNGQFLLIYLGSALAGSALSLHYTAQQSVSVGASGAVFGVLGALVAALIQHRHRLPPSTRKNLLGTQAAFVAYSLVQGFAHKGIDNAAHVGGLVAGGVIAWLLVERLDEQATAAKRVRDAGLAGTVCAAVVGLLVATTGEPPIDHARGFEARAQMQRSVAALQQVERAVQQDAKANKSGQMPDVLMIKALRERHLPAIRKVRDSLAPLSLPATDPGAAALSDFQQLTTLMVEIVEMEVGKAEGRETADVDARIQARGAELKKVSERLKAGASKKT